MKVNRCLRVALQVATYPWRPRILGTARNDKILLHEVTKIERFLKADLLGVLNQESSFHRPKQLRKTEEIGSVSIRHKDHTGQPILLKGTSLKGKNHNSTLSKPKEVYQVFPIKGWPCTLAWENLLRITAILLPISSTSNKTWVSLSISLQITRVFPWD
jgi:hypothetical protein